MKTLFLLSLSLIISLNLNARENPFEATNAYEEEAARIIELHESEEEASIAAQEAQYIEQMQRKMEETKQIEEKNKVQEAVNKIVPMIKDEKKEKQFSEKEVKQLIKKAQIQSENRAKQIIKKELEKKEMVEPKQVVYVKPRVDIIDDEPTLKTKEILPFLKVEYNDEKLIIHTEHKVSKKFTLAKDNKIIIDYKANLNFYTKREDLESKEFLKVAVGNHKKERYFRVVLKVNEKPSNYKVEYKDNLITIIKIDDM